MNLKNLIIPASIIIFIVLAGLLFVGLKKGFNANAIDEDIREIIIDAKRFEYNPNVIKINYGEKVRLRLNNLDDGEHGFSVPDFGIEVHDKKGVVFIADKKGEFEFYCHHYCGYGHGNMKGMVIVE